jgi:energy-coupling factor transporter ATP-binding protein EcfA2
MITSITLHNFATYEDCTIPLGPFTVITGQNLSGKSQLWRALAWVLYNDGAWSDDPEKNEVRREVDGELANETSVTVRFDDGLQVTRYRSAKPARNAYDIVFPNGETMEIGGPGTNVGAGFCEDVGKLTGIVPIKFPCDKTASWLNFANDARNGAFLLQDGGAKIDVKLGSVVGLDTLEGGTRIAGSRATGLLRELTGLRRQRDTVNDALSAYDCVSEVDAVVRVYEDAALKSDHTLVRKNNSFHQITRRLVASSWIDLKPQLQQAMTLTQDAIAGSQRAQVASEASSRGMRLVSELQRNVGIVSNKDNLDVVIVRYSIINGCNTEYEYRKERAEQAAKLSYSYEYNERNTRLSVPDFSEVSSASGVYTRAQQTADAAQSVLLKLLSSRHTIVPDQHRLDELNEESILLLKSVTCCPVNDTWVCPFMQQGEEF